jgi:hypothetical protein
MKIDPKVAARARMVRYRAAHRRLDYVPSPFVLAIVERHLAAGLDVCTAGVIDHLIAAGDKAITGNGQSQR